MAPPLYLSSWLTPSKECIHGRRNIKVYLKHVSQINERATGHRRLLRQKYETVIAYEETVNFASTPPPSLSHLPFVPRDHLDGNVKGGRGRPLQD